MSRCITFFICILCVSVTLPDDVENQINSAAGSQSSGARETAPLLAAPVDHGRRVLAARDADVGAAYVGEAPDRCQDVLFGLLGFMMFGIAGAAANGWLTQDQGEDYQ